MTPRPLILPPSTPSELITSIIAQYRHPTTIIIGYPNDVFLQGLVTDVKSQITPSEGSTTEEPKPQHESPESHPLLRGSLLQTAVSHHIRVVFTPTLAHFRAYVSIFSPSDSRVAAPPVPQTTSHPPLLLAYGFLELHRHVSEWSAQGISMSLSALIAAASRHGFQAAVAEPKGAGGFEELDEFLKDNVPILNGTVRAMDGSWSGRTVEIGRVLARWCRVSKGNKSTAGNLKKDTC